MADYIYLLQNRLSAAQQAALLTIRDVAKAHGVTVFLVGGAVRDLTSGSPVRDLDVVVQGNALRLKKDLELAGAKPAGEVAAWQAFFAHFPGGVRVEVGSTLSVTYPKPGKPVAVAATILDDLRRRDFTANAMALSLNEGSYGLLMDPLNGVADIENRQLRLVSNYGFIEDPVRMIRAVRFSARLGWTMDDKTQTRYETGKAEKYIGTLSATHRGYESEEIFHEEDPLRVLRKLEEEGWMKHLFPALTAAKANAAELERLREVQTQLQVAGINPDAAAANFPLLTAKMSSGDIAELKKSFIRQGFVRDIEGQEAEAKEFAGQLAGKSAALPSQAWKLIHAAKPEAVLWVAYSSKNPTVQTKLKSFHTEWPKARQKVPFTLMAEMRIVPELDTFNEVVDKVFFELMDGNLATPEEQKAFLEPFSPPAPPPPVRLGRSRAGKKDGKASKGKKKIAEPVDDDDEHDLDLDADRDNDADEAASLPDDENEDASLTVPLTEEAGEAGGVFVLNNEPEPVPVAEPEAEPTAPPEPVQAGPKSKRKKLVPIEAKEPEVATPAPIAEAAPVPPAKAKHVAPARDQERPAVRLAPAKIVEKVKLQPLAPEISVMMAEAPAKAAKTSAKKRAVPVAPPTPEKAVNELVAKLNKESGKEVAAPPNESVPGKSAAVAKGPAQKAGPTPAKATGKKGR